MLGFSSELGSRISQESNWRISPKMDSGISLVLILDLSPEKGPKLIADKFLNSFSEKFSSNSLV